MIQTEKLFVKIFRYLTALILFSTSHSNMNYRSGQHNKIVLGPFVEQQRAGVLVGNVASTSNIASELPSDQFSTLRYEFLDPSDLQTASLFTINVQTGGVFTSAMIDRDVVCGYQEECMLSFVVSIMSDTTDFLRVISVSVNVTDINDNVPTFPVDKITLTVQESNTPGVTYPLPAATDKDTLRNSIVGYTLHPESEDFTLLVKRTLDESFKASLQINVVLDREEHDEYLFKVTAHDGGLSSLTGTLSLAVIVTDVNDNVPTFSQQNYAYKVQESAPINTFIGQVDANDEDSGLNAKLTYSFSRLLTSRSRILDFFAINQQTGDLRTTAPLQYVSGQSFEAVVKVRDAGFPQHETQATLDIAIIDTENNPPQIHFLPKNPLYANTVLLGENAKIPTLVGTMQVHDNDPGISGSVHCQASHQKFSVRKLGLESNFLVLLQRRLDREHHEKFNVTIYCADSGAPPMTSVSTFSVIVGDVNDNAPVFSQHVYIANLSENSPVGVRVTKVEALDADKGFNGQFFYYVHPQENELFLVDSKTGVLTANAVFDRETNTEVSVIIKAIDEGDKSMTGTATVVVYISDVNDNVPRIVAQDLFVTEGNSHAQYVGSLSAYDNDDGINAEVEFSVKITDSLLPFTVFRDGRVFTSGEMEIDREQTELYVFQAYVKDKGVPSLTSSATVRVIVLDVNDNSPEVLYPNSKNNTVTIPWNQPPKISFARIDATDRDNGDSAKLTFILAGNDNPDLFEVSRETGNVRLRRYVQQSDATFYRVRLTVLDGGKPQLQTQTLLHVRIDLVNATFAQQEIPTEVERNLLLAGIICGATIVLSIVVIIIICQVRVSNRGPQNRSEKTVLDQRNKMSDKEKCANLNSGNNSWNELQSSIYQVSTKTLPETLNKKTKKHVMCGDMIMKNVVGSPCNSVNLQSSFANNDISNIEKEKGFQHPDKVVPIDQYRKQDFYTFCKVRSNIDDVHSVTSGETTASDSGRGVSEDDAMLAAISELQVDSGALRNFKISNGRNTFHSINYSGNNMSRKQLVKCQAPDFKFQSKNIISKPQISHRFCASDHQKIPSLVLEKERHSDTVSQYGSTVNQYGSTLNQYGSTVSQYGSTVNQYGNTVKQYGNTVNKNGNTVNQYGNTVNQYGNTVNQNGNTVNQYGNTKLFAVERLPHSNNNCSDTGHSLANMSSSTSNCRTLPAGSGRLSEGKRQVTFELDSRCSSVDEVDHERDDI